MALIAIGALVTLNIAMLADPIKLGICMALTGGEASIGKQVLTACKSGATTSTPRAGCWPAGRAGVL